MGAEVSTFPLPPAEGIWGWEIAVYLFLGGMVAGLMILAGYAHRKWERPPASLSWWAPVLAPAVLIVGMMALFLDLEHKLHAFRFYMTFKLSSPMSWGSWVLLMVFPCSLAFLWQPLRKRLAPLNIALGAALGIYTGILLGTLGARPLWNTPLLGPLFLVSGLSASAALLTLLEPSPEYRDWLAKLDLKLLAAEAATLALILIALTTGGEAQRTAAHLFFGGPFTAVFWILIAGGGLALPAAMELLHRSGKAQNTAWVQIFVLLGGLALRAVLLVAGQASHWETLL